MVGEKPDLPLGLCEKRGRQGGLAQEGTGDGKRFDRSRLASRTSPLARLRHQLWRDPYDTLAAGEQEALERARHMTAVLERSHPLLIQGAPPEKQLPMPRLARGDRALSDELARRSLGGGRGVTSLVGVDSDYDHFRSPFLGWPLTAECQRTGLSGGV